MEFRTRVVHGGDAPRDASGAVVVPIHPAATFAHPGVGQTTGFDYSRVENPTRDHLEKLMVDLEYGVGAVACATGMAAIACVGELFVPGDHIVTNEDLYGGSIRYFRTIMAKNGVTFATADMDDMQALRAAITPATKAVFVETPTNPMMHVIDIAAVASVTRELGLLLIVDNTFLSPYFQNPLQLGANIVVHSGTKYLGGHHDSLAGYVVSDSAELAERIRTNFATIGFALSPFDSYLQIRGIKTLALRMEAASAAAMEIAQWLQAHPKVTAVHYVGLPDHPGRAISDRQARGHGSMVSFEVDSESTALTLLDRVELIAYAESLGGVESLITYPMTQTHAEVPEAERLARGINERLLRLSVGVEDARDLIADLERGLA